MIFKIEKKNMHSYVLNKNIIDNLYILTIISTNYRYSMLKHEKSLHSMSIMNIYYEYISTQDKIPSARNGVEFIITCTWNENDEIKKYCYND